MAPAAPGILSRKSAPHSVELMILKAHLDKCQIALKCVPKKLTGLSKEEREKCIAVLTEEHVIWPAVSQLHLLDIAVTEHIEKAAFDLAVWLEMVSPWSQKSEEAPFSAKSPKLRECSFEKDGAEVALAKAHQKLVIRQTLCPMILEESSRQGDLLKLLPMYMKETETSRLLEQGLVIHPVLARAVTQVRSCAEAVLLLLQPSSTPTEQQMKSLDDVMKARDGVQNLLRLAITQTTVFSTLEKDYRACHLAHLQLGPAVEAATETLQKAVEEGTAKVEVFRPMLLELPNWRKNLRSGSTDVLAGLLLATAQDMTKGSTNDDIAAMSSLQAVLADMMSKFACCGLAEAL